jgi:hypothetical protein
MSLTLSKLIDSWYGRLDGNETVEEYHRRHETESACILTNCDDEHAGFVAEHLREKIEGKIVVEIGAGVGLLACHLAMYAKRVYAIEVDPAWTASFVWCLYEKKPANLTFIFGRAEEAPPIAADVALFCTYSGRESMHKAATLFAPEVIDVYADLMRDNPKWQEVEHLTW